MYKELFISLFIFLLFPWRLAYAQEGDSIYKVGQTVKLSSWRAKCTLATSKALGELLNREAEGCRNFDVDVREKIIDCFHKGQIIKHNVGVLAKITQVLNLNDASYPDILRPTKYVYQVELLNGKMQGKRFWYSYGYEFSEARFEEIITFSDYPEPGGFDRFAIKDYWESKRNGDEERAKFWIRGKGVIFIPANVPMKIQEWKLDESGTGVEHFRVEIISGRLQGKRVWIEPYFAWWKPPVPQKSKGKH